MVADLCNHFLSATKSRVDSGELALGTFNEYKRSCERLVQTFGKMRPVNTIGPSDFTKLRGVITSRYGPSRTSKEVVQTRTIFTWGHRQELNDAPRFGPEFVKPSRDVLRRHRQANPPKMFRAEELRAMLNVAGVHTRAWILLGINCGFIQKDLSDLTVAAVDHDNAMIDFPRRKTAVERRAPLWPETVRALEESRANRWHPLEGADGERFFISRQGNHLVRELETSARSDAVHGAMQCLQKKLDIKRYGRSFGALRHTFRTISDETRDFPPSSA